MAKYKVIFDKNTCIGALACMSISTEFFEPDDSGKVNLVKGSFNQETGCFEAIFDEKDLYLNQEAEKNCPVKAIKVIKID